MRAHQMVHRQCKLHRVAWAAWEDPLLRIMWRTVFLLSAILNRYLVRQLCHPQNCHCLSLLPTVPLGCRPAWIHRSRMFLAFRGRCHSWRPSKQSQKTVQAQRGRPGRQKVT